MVTGSPSRRTVWPIASGRDERLLVQNVYDSTITSGAPGAPSPGAKPRPSIGFQAKKSRYSVVTSLTPVRTG